MKTLRAAGAFFAILLPLASLAAPTDRAIPEALRPWESWATWDDPHRLCPTPYSDPKVHRCFWPSRLILKADASGARFELGVTVFHTAWMPLPGGADAWPTGVRSNGVPAPVLEHQGGPAVQLGPGTFRLEGSYQWSSMPQRIRIPQEIGILELTVDGRAVEAPTWDAQGLLWLKRDGAADEGEKNFLSLKLYSLLEDGIPIWLRREVELVVSGKSREEDLGAILPEGWKLASVDLPLPVAVDEGGRMKVQVRTGKWTLRAEAFRVDNPTEIRFASATKPAASEELLAFRAKPDFRVVEIVGPQAVDISQLEFPARWRDLPVYRWDPTTPLRLEQRMRGMGDQTPAGLTIAREWWLEGSGRELTFRDRVSGAMQQVWRLDIAEGLNLGSVSSDGQGQLITRNPANGAAGVEVRTRNLNLEAAGRMPRSSDFSATGWRSDADSLSVTLHLPPGWRLFALFGADWVRGDWLTAWTLLDLFLLLIFTLAVLKLWGFVPALLAGAAFALSYHEPGAPRYLWLALLIPLALQNRVPEGWGRRIVQMAKWITVGALVLVLAPFLAGQVQQALYPQLEPMGRRLVTDWAGLEVESPAREMAFPPEPALRAGARPEPQLMRRYGLQGVSSAPGQQQFQNANLNFDAKARIQTGPGVPKWTWRAVSFGWNGPVQTGQRVRPILIPAGLERALSVLRVALLLALAGWLLRAGLKGQARPSASLAKAAALAALFTLFHNLPAHAQSAAPAGRNAADAAALAGPIPDQATLNLLRERLLQPSDAFPNAADIASASLKLSGRRLTLDVEIHTALRTAVPLPGRLPAWSPVTVLVNERPEAALRRDDGFLWVALPAGVHRVRVEGLLANLGEWDWTFLLKPRVVKIDAPDWNFSGVGPNGVPEQQIFFAPKQRVEPNQGDAASYERQDLQPIVAVERRLELGLVWQVRTIVTRLSPVGKAIALRVPLLPGENVYSANTVVNDQAVDVRLGAQEQTMSWESGLTPTNSLSLATRTGDVWVERWHLVASPVWNVTISGLAPVFEAGINELVPVWSPWPGESAALGLSRPEAIAGATVTVDRGYHEVSLGRRQRASRLELSLRCSLGEDFPIRLPADAEVTELRLNGQAIPVRLDAGNLVIPVRPGQQSLQISWKVNTPLGLRAEADEIRLPVESANILTVIGVPEDRWVLWTSGPTRGPAVRFWVILICALLAAFALSRAKGSPLRGVEWMLLVIGLTQVPLPAALAVVGWLFLLAWRGLPVFQRLDLSAYNAAQVLLILATAVALGVLLFAVGEGLLGSPEMFITGNGSSRTLLRWFQDRSDPLLPQPSCVSISIWWYRFLMLAWALWLAFALIRWLQMGWRNFGSGGFFRRKAKAPDAASPVAAAN